MDTQKLLKVAQEILAEFQEDSFTSLLTQINDYVAQNTAAGYESADEAREKLYEVLDSSVTNTYAPSYREILIILQAESYVGIGARVELEEIFSGSPLDLSTRLSKYLTGHNELVIKLNNLIAGLTGIGIEPYKTDSFEIGYLLPSDLNNLQEVTKQLKYYDSFLKIAAEIAGENNGNPKLERVSTGTLEFFIVGGVGLAKLVETVLKRVLALYKEVESIKKISAEVEQLKANTTKTKSETLKNLATLEKEYRDEYINSTVEDVMQEYKGSAERKAELATQLGVAVKVVLSDIQKGVKVEVSPPDSEANQAMDKATEKIVDSIAATNSELQFLYLKPREELALPFKVNVTSSELEKLELSESTTNSNPAKKRETKTKLKKSNK